MREPRCTWYEVFYLYLTPFKYNFWSIDSCTWRPSVGLRFINLKSRSCNRCTLFEHVAHCYKSVVICAIDILIYERLNRPSISFYVQVIFYLISSKSCSFFLIIYSWSVLGLGVSDLMCRRSLGKRSAETWTGAQPRLMSTRDHYALFILLE